MKSLASYIPKVRHLIGMVVPKVNQLGLVEKVEKTLKKIQGWSILIKTTNMRTHKDKHGSFKS